MRRVKVVVAAAMVTVTVTVAVMAAVAVPVVRSYAGATSAAYDRGCSPYRQSRDIPVAAADSK